MVDSTNPRVIADNIKKLSAGNMANADAIEALGTYSTDEVDTGMEYGGYTIYRKIIKGTTPTTETAAIPFTYSHILFWYGTVVAASNAIYDLNRALSIYISTNSINIAQPSSAFQGTAFEIIILYTKAVAPLPNLAPTPDVSPAPDSRSLEEEPKREVEEPINEELKKEEK